MPAYGTVYASQRRRQTGTGHSRRVSGFPFESGTRQPGEQRRFDPLWIDTMFGAGLELRSWQQLGEPFGQGCVEGPATT